MKAYKVERDDSHECPTCGHGCIWEVVGPDDVALGVSYTDKEDADDVAEELSLAYEAGLMAERERQRRESK
jgi:hypothetical protein